MMTYKIHPSILCAPHGNLAQVAQDLQTAGADYLHMDVMDGCFVPNFGLGTEVFTAVSAACSVPLDVHLMIASVQRHLEKFARLGAQIITIHPQTCDTPAAALAEIRRLGCRAGIALCPGTSIETIAEMLPMVDHVLVMTVHPGFGGQRFLDATIPKIKRLGQMRQAHGFDLCVDGNVTVERIPMLLEMGVQNFVVGTAAFGGGSIADALALLRGGCT